MLNKITFEFYFELPQVKLIDMQLNGKEKHITIKFYLHFSLTVLFLNVKD